MLKRIWNIGIIKNNVIFSTLQHYPTYDILNTNIKLI
jgi:hypothetical protein